MVRFQLLRSLLFESVASIKKVQVRSGHTDVKTTLDIYAQVSMRQTEATAIRFANFMNDTEIKQNDFGMAKSMVKMKKSRLHL